MNSRGAGSRAAGSAVVVLETFTSIQGESTYAGTPCFFIRLAGCNLACSYCDTPAGAGRRASVASLVRKALRSGAGVIEITGGEPLLQAGFPALARALRDRTRRPVLVETNGSRNISVIPHGVTAIMDVKTPGSGMHSAMDPQNIRRLRDRDEVKFVITGRGDYTWARAFVRKHRLASACRAILFSPAAGRLKPAVLAGWILKDRLPVRLQVQLHRIIGLP